MFLSVVLLAIGEIKAHVLVDKLLIINRLSSCFNLDSNMCLVPQLGLKKARGRVHLDKWPLTLRDSGLIYAHLTGILACLMTLAFRRLLNKHHNRRSRQTTLGIYRRILWENP